MKFNKVLTLFAVLGLTATTALADGTFTGGDGSQTNPYQIATTDDLDLLASQVNGGTDYSNTYFVLTADITYPHTTDWDNASSTEHNYTAIGGYDGSNNYYFKGHFDGGNHTISGIRIYKSGNDDTDKYQGLFGKIGSSATVKNVIIADTRIAGYNYTGTIVAFNKGGTIENCHVLSNVAVQAVREIGYVNDHGGIAGCNDIGGTIIGCTSAAAITTASANGSEGFGGITGYNQQYGTVSNCLYLGNALGNAKGVGAIVGVNWYGTVTNCYFTSTTIQGKDNSGTAIDNVNSAIGDNNSSDVTNCGLAYTITLDNGVTLGGNVTVYHNLTAYGNFALVYNDGSSTTIYSTSEAQITLDYGDSPDDYSCFDNYTSSDVTITNGSFTMPAKDVTIGATWTTPVVSVTHDGTTKNYANLTGALDAAQAGDVITLLSNVNLTDVLTVNKDIKLDLAGYTIDRGLANSETAESNGNVINIDKDCTLTLDDSSADKTGTITGGYNNSYGGGVYVRGTFIMNGGTITGNQTTSDGGGVFVQGTFTMNDGAITRNLTSTQGGGVYVQGTFTMKGGAITENRSNYSGGWWGASENEDVGGGVFVGAGNHFCVSGAPKITGNVFSLKGTGEPSAADLCFFLLNEDFIELTGALTEGASIGIRSKSAYTLTSEWNTYMGTNKPSDYLFSNNGYRVGISDEGEAMLTSDILDLQAEIDAADDGSTITLQKDYVSLSGDNQLLLRGRALTLDLNGHTIDYSANNTSSCIIRCDEGTTLTLKDSGGEGKLIGNPDKSYFYGISYGNSAADGTLNSFTMEGGTISGCKQAGVYVYSCVFTMNGGTISDNVGYGVEVSSNSDMILSDGEISNNGNSGVYFSSYNHTFTMTGGKINNNHGSNGGGVNIGGGTFYMEGGEISGNTSNYYGGGLYCSSNFIMSGGKITDNHCASSSIYNAGGVYASLGLTILGKVTIIGNTQGDSYTENNMYLSTNQKITIDAPLDTASRIGALYISDDKYLPTSNLTIGFAEYAHWENFVVDEGSNCRLATDGEELVWTSMTNEDMSHTVTFMDGETTLLTEYVKVAENAHAVAPIVPTKDGLSFVGWMLNDEVYDFSTAVTGDITLIATYELTPATAPTISAQPENLTLTYGYTADNTLTITANSIDEHNLSYQWYSNTSNSNKGGSEISGATNASYSVSTGKNAGTTEYYYCVVTATRTDNSQTAETVSNTATVTITPAAVTLTANSGTETYNGTEQSVSGFACSVDGLTFDGVEASGSGTNAGEYAVTFTGATLNTTKDVTGNYVVTEIVAGKLTINLADPEIPGDLTATIGQTLADVALPEGWTWNDPTLTVGSTTGAFSFSATYTETENYKGKNAELTILVTNGSVTRINNVNANTAENDVWYDIIGRRVNGKPTTPGLYIHNGKKELVK